MLVETLEHGKALVSHLLRVEKAPWVCIDTETKPKPLYEKDKEAALVFDRMQVTIWSLCYRGASYSFPTSAFDGKYPLMSQWAKTVLVPLWQNPRVVKVFHNANYDLNALYEFLPWIPLFWDTMIGGWLADNSIEKGLKARAPRYGVFLRETKAIEHRSISEISEYAEDDVIATDMLYQMQTRGEYVSRRVPLIQKDGTIVKDRERFHPPGTRLVIPEEAMKEEDFYFAKFQEFACLKAVLRAERAGLPFDRLRIRMIRKQVDRDLERAKLRAYRLAGEKINLRSGKQLVNLFNQLGISIPNKTAKGNPSLDAASLFKMQEFHPFVKMLIEVRKTEKLQSTYTGEDGLEHYFNPKTGCVHPTINPIGAGTGRTSSSNPNGQNIPSRADTYGIRECFVAEPRRLRIGKRPKKLRKLAVIDYAQLELRVMALLSKDKMLTQVLSDPEGDIHTTTAERFNVERDPTAKQLNFLLQYGGAEWMLSEKLTIEGVPTTVEQARAYIQTYDKVYCAVRPFRDDLVDVFLAQGYVRYAIGRRRNLEMPSKIDRYTRHKLETTLSNNIVQGTGQDFLKASIVRTDYKQGIIDEKVLQSDYPMSKAHRAYLTDCVRKLRKYHRLFEKAKLIWHFQVHDENIYSMDTEYAESVLRACTEIMTWRHYLPLTTEYTVPLVAEGGIGDTWKKAKGKNAEIKAKLGYDSL